MAAETRENGGGKRLRLGLVDDVDDVSMPGLTSDSEDDEDEDEDEVEDEDEDEDDDADEELSEEEAQRRYFEDRQKQAKASADSWAAFFERKAGQQRAAQQHADAQRAAGPPSDALGASASASEKQQASPTITTERERAATCFTERGDNKRADYSKGELAELMRQAQAFIKETFEANRQKNPKPSDKKALSAAVDAAHRRFGIPLTSLRNYWSGEGKTPSSRNSQVGISKPGVKPLLQKNPDGLDLEGKLVEHLLRCAETDYEFFDRDAILKDLHHTVAVNSLAIHVQRPVTSRVPRKLKVRRPIHVPVIQVGPMFSTEDLGVSTSDYSTELANVMSKIEALHMAAAADSQT